MYTLYDYLVERKSDGKKFVIGNANFKEPGLRATRLFEVLDKDEKCPYPVHYNFGCCHGTVATANISDSDLRYNSKEYRVVFQTRREGL